MAVQQKVTPIADAKKGKDHLLDRVANATALRGNKKRRTKHISSDLLNAMGGSYKDLAVQCNLSTSTVKRVCTLSAAASGKEYNPNALTLEKVIEAADCYLEVKKL